MARMKKILVAYDGSTQSKEALDWAINLSLMSEALVIAVKVVEPLEIGQAYAMYEAGYGKTLIEKLTNREEADKKLLQDAIDFGRQKGVTVTTDLLQGNIRNVWDIFIREHRLFYIGIFLLIIAALVYLYLIFAG